MKLPRDIWLGIGGMFAGVIFYFVARRIQDWQFDVLGASFFPKLASVLMVLFGLMLLVTSLPEIKNAPEKKSSKNSPNTLYINLIFISCLVFYLVLLPLIGFIYSSVALILIMYFLITRTFNLRELIKGASYAVLSVLFVWLIFTKEFELILP